MSRPNQEVRVWNVQDRRTSPQYQNRPWVVRWRIGTKRFQASFRTRDEADHRRSELLLAQRVGEVFDRSTGEPASWQEREKLTVHSWTRRWIAEQWDEWQPRTRRSALEEMSRFVPLLVQPLAPDPPSTDLRRYLEKALQPDADLDQEIERWLDRWIYSLDQLDRSILAEVDHKLGIGVRGGVLSPTTALRYRRTARSCIRRAVDLDLIDRNPWPPPMRGASNRKVRRKARSQAIDIKTLPDPATMRRALAAMVNHQPASRQYQTMTSVMAYAGLRPSEVVMLRPRALTLPASGWGIIEVVEADIDFDEPGDPKTGNRTVPIPTELVVVLNRWLDAVGPLKPDQLIFRTRTSSRPSQSNWGRAWQLALSKVDHERLRVYDCRHFAATTWLHAGVPLGETARRLGHSVETLVGTYVGALKGDERTANRLIDTYWSQQTAAALDQKQSQAKSDG